jgi:hypothetical protein
MDFRDKDGAPLIPWTDSRGAFEAWKECSRGWLCDYSGLTYEKLEAGGIQWPCTEAAPTGTARLYTDHVFRTAADRCETYGHDLATGAAIPPEKYRAADPAGRAVLRAAEVEPPRESADDEFPLLLTTGRRVHHFHTRTKTGRAPALAEAAPDVYVEISAENARELGIREGDLLEVETRRGKMEGPARLAELAPGHLFVPFHYGWWDAPGRLRAANELTMTEWDPVSKQPYFKQGAARVRKIEAYSLQHGGGILKKAAGGARDAVRQAKNLLELTRPHLSDYLGILEGSLTRMAQAAVAMTERHPSDPEVTGACCLFDVWLRRRLADLSPIADRCGRKQKAEGEKPRAVRAAPRKAGGLGLVRDLHDFWVLAHETKAAVIVLTQAARALRDKPFETLLESIAFETERQIGWILTKLKQSAPQALVVPS